MASVGAGSAYATDIVAVQRVFYGQTYNFAYQWMVVMSTQLIGFSIGGIARRFLVAPPSMIWPADLVLCALFNTLHSRSYQGVGTRGGLSRERFFTCTSLFVTAGPAVLTYAPQTRSSAASSGTSSLATSSARSPTSAGCAGSRRTMSRSTRCSATSTAWACPSSPSTGARLHTSARRSRPRGGPLRTSPVASS